MKPQRLIDADAFRREIDTYPPFDKETQDSNAMANLAKESLLVALNNMPTIDAVPHWIPCSERMPEEPFGCLVTVWDTDSVPMYEFENILPYFVGWDGEQWNDADGEQCPFEVLAWMPLPKPYEVEDEKTD